ncbi:uncharacterized protein LOC144127536 [Amblyomma americanum]
MTTNAVTGASVIIFGYLVFHCLLLHHTFRGALLCLEKYRLNRHNNQQAADIYHSSVTFYTIRTVLNIIYVTVDVSALTALLMTFVNGIIKSRSRFLFVRCCSDVRDSMAMYLGCSVVLTLISSVIRKFEIFVLTITPYDPVECCGAKEFLYLKGRLNIPEYSANAVSRFVGFGVIDCLATGFKVMMMMRLFELYDDMSQHIAIMTLIAKKRLQGGTASPRTLAAAFGTGASPKALSAAT